MERINRLFIDFWNEFDNIEDNKKREDILFDLNLMINERV